MINLIDRAHDFANCVAVSSEGNTFFYGQLLKASESIAAQLLSGETDLKEKRVALVIDPGINYVKTLWAIWRAGGIAVPLHPKAPAESHHYVLKDAGVSHLVTDAQYRPVLEKMAGELGVRMLSPEEGMDADLTLPNITPGRGAMILYTSGTTGNPKGVLTTHQNIEAQITSLVEAWEWSQEDHILNVLPMHHVHGIINVLSCALWSGATCEFMPFDAEAVLERLAKGDINLFMAVPTIYYKLINQWEGLSESEQQRISKTLKSMRLMVSGSAALPVPVLEKWKEISGHTLLERYGMTEIGMAISNAYRGTRLPGFIGKPLPGVSIMLKSEEDSIHSEEKRGEILVKGDGVFVKYWDKPEATTEAFTDDGWFMTGDIALLEEGNYKIIGRQSVDIIKSGGYKLSALEIEGQLLAHQKVQECAVVGLPDEEWGEVVAAALVITGEPDFEELKSWLSQKLAPYKIPRVWRVMRELPRNTMGKVVKKELKEQLRKGI